MKRALLCLTGSALMAVGLTSMFLVAATVVGHPAVAFLGIPGGVALFGVGVASYASGVRVVMGAVS